MFTGLVQGVGRIVAVAAAEEALRLDVDPGTLETGDVRIGDSIAVSGCCLTVTSIDGRRITFDVSLETVRCTSGLDAPCEVNLEPALKVGDRLGGHLMSGHVDGVGCVVSCAPVANAGGNVELVIDAPPAIARFIATKGSVAVDGVSLTVNAVAGCRFSINLIPHTLQATTFRLLASGTRVNLEVDMIARYVARLAEMDSPGGSTNGG